MHAGHPRGGGLTAFGNLDETGLQFAQMLQKRPTWQTEWAEMTEHGTPLPNEMIVLSSVGSGMTFCFVPVVDGKEITHMVVAPVITKEDSANQVSCTATSSTLCLGKPYIFDEKTVDKNSVSRSLIGLGFDQMWKDKGYEIDFEVTPRPQLATTRTGGRLTYAIEIIYALSYTYGGKDPYGGLNIGEYVRNMGIVESFRYIRGYAEGVYISVPYRREYYGGDKMYFVDIDHVEDTIDASTVLYSYIQDLKTHIRDSLPYSYEWGLSNIRISYMYAWGAQFDDLVLWEEFYGYGSSYSPPQLPNNPSPGVPGTEISAKLNDFPDDKPNDPESDCETMREVKTKIGNVYDSMRLVQGVEYNSPGQSPYTYPPYQDFVDAVNRTPSREHSFTIIKPDWAQGDAQLGVNGGYLGHPDGVAHGSTDTVAVKMHPNMISTIHNHPSTGKPTPSAVDLFSTWRSVAHNPDFQGAYILASNGDVYCISVTMSDAQRDFWRSVPSDGIDASFDQVFNYFVDPNTNWFKADSDMYKDLKKAYNQFRRLGVEDATCHALSYVADKFGMGLTVMRKKASESNFASKHVKRDENGKYVPAECL